LNPTLPSRSCPLFSVRKQIKIRPGFTPQEDVSRFRGSKQTQYDANQLPKGHIIGWVPPSVVEGGAPSKPTSKSARKNAKRREKKKETVADNWEDDDEETSKKTTPQTNSGDAEPPVSPNGDAAGPDEASLTAKLEKLDVK